MSRGLLPTSPSFIGIIHATWDAFVLHLPNEDRRRRLLRHLSLERAKMSVLLSSSQLLSALLSNGRGPRLATDEQADKSTDGPCFLVVSSLRRPPPRRVSNTSTIHVAETTGGALPAISVGSRGSPYDGGTSTGAADMESSDVCGRRQIVPFGFRGLSTTLPMVPFLSANFKRDWTSCAQSLQR